MTLYFKDGRAKVEIALARQEDLGQAANPRRARSKPRSRTRPQPPPQRHGLTGDRACRVAIPGVLAEARPALASFDVHVHFLPAEHPAPGVGAVRHGRAEDRPEVADPLPRQPRGARRRCCASSAYVASRRCPTRTSPGSLTYLNDWARRLRDRRAGVAVVGHLLPRAGGGRRTSASWSTRGSRCSRSTSRSAPSGSTTRSLDDGLGAPRVDAGTPVVVHAGSGPVPQRLHRARAARAGAGSLARGLAVVVAHLGAPEYAEFLDAGRALRAGVPGHHDGLHGLLRARWRRTRLRCCRGSPTWATKVLLGQRLPDDPVPVRCTSSRRWSGSASGNTGCARCVGTTVRDYSE